MRVLRSREVISATKPEYQPKPVKNGVEIGPSTPAKAVESTNKLSYETTPGSASCPDSGQGRRRSARLSFKSSSSGAVENVSFRSKRKAIHVENGNGEECSGANRLSLFDSGGDEKDHDDCEMVGNTLDGCEAKNVLVTELGPQDDGREGNWSGKKVKGKWRASVDVEALGSELVGEAAEVKGCLKLRSGKRLLKPSADNGGDDVEHLSACEDGKKGQEGEDEPFCDGLRQDGLTNEAERGSTGNRICITKARKRFSREDKGKGIAVNGIIQGELDLERKSDTAAGEGMYIDGKSEVNGTRTRGRKRHNMEEKGKVKAVEVDSSASVFDMINSSMKPSVESAVSVSTSLEPEIQERADTNVTRGYQERFKEIARKNASRFAHFSAQKEDETPSDGAEPESPRGEATEDVEDWPGPFSTALKIIKERAVVMHAQQPDSFMEKNHPVPLVWVPKKTWKSDRIMKDAPSLQELCMTILARNADAISSLDSVPDVIRHKLTQLLCDHRKMNAHFLGLLASGSPSEIRVRDCSWLTEEQFTKTFEKADIDKLTVLQLDQCGRCLPDYVLFATLARMPNKLSSLTNISLKGACRLSDTGLSALVASAPALRSVNLRCCSLLTSDGITNLADKLGSVLKELYIDECFNVDAMYILPALLKLEHLEVLSLSRSETVCDSFVKQLVAVRGHKIKELVLADCMKLTDKSLKAIAESCPDLCAIDLTNLSKLTDSAIGHLANGCQRIQTMKLRCNAFSDESVAAYLEACGESLKELSLNHVDKVSHCTALSLAKRSRNLVSLDLSWCRNMTNEALGLIVDSCLSLKVLKLFGCTQVTEMFMDGHSNEEVKIIGLKTSQILKSIEVPDLLPLRYSCV